MTNRSGWAYGTTSTGRWLTILGSAHTRPALHPTREQAEAALDASGLRGKPWRDMKVARVTEVWHPGVTANATAYRITEGTAA